MQRKPLSEYSCVKCLSIGDIENIYKWARKTQKDLCFNKPSKALDDAIKHYGYVYYLPFKCFYCILPCSHYHVYDNMNAFIRACKEIGNNIEVDPNIQKMSSS